MVNDGSRLFIVFFFFLLIQRQTIVTKIKQYFAFFLFNHEKYGVLEMHKLNTIFLAIDVQMITTMDNSIHCTSED